MALFIMTGVDGRAKGRRGELEAARVLGGNRISESGMPGPDVHDRDGDLWEVKRTKRRWKRVYDAIKQNYEQAPRVIFRDDREEWIVAMPLWVYARKVGWKNVIQQKTAGEDD